MTERRDHKFSRPDLAAQMVSDILKERVASVKEEKAARAQSLRKRASPPRHLLWLMPIFLGLTGWNVWRSGRPPAVLSDAQLTASRRLNVYLAVEAVQEYKRTTGALPPTLEVAGITTPGLVYTTADPSYTVSDTTGPNALIYRSGQDLSMFAAAFHALRRAGGAGSGQ
jgi:hypothetical protein